MAREPKFNRSLLLLNLAVDEEDPVLGFAVSWIREIAQHFDHVDVLTMRVGRYDLPSSVNVHPIPPSRFGVWGRALRANWVTLRLLFRHKPTMCFAHMNANLLASLGPMLLAFGVPRILWYAHRSVTIPLRVATWFAQSVISSNSEGFCVPTPKFTVTGHGIDCAKFSPLEETHQASERPFTIGIVGRISRIKRLELAIEAVREITTFEPAPPTHLLIVGAASGVADESYRRSLEALVQERGLQQQITFVGPISPSKLPDRIRHLDCVLSLADNSSLDKSLLEAMACGVPVVGTQQYRDVLNHPKLPLLVTEATPRRIAERINDVRHLPPGELRETRRLLRSIILSEHSLSALMERVAYWFSRAPATDLPDSVETKGETSPR